MGQSVYDPFAIIIDFSDFEYNWGDNLDLSFDEVGSVKTVIIVGDKCRRGMSTLTYGIDTNKDIVDDVFFFDNFDKALEKLER